ncbi:MAG: phosphatidylserine decarboxylase [Desulfomonilaceae bacterium]
MTAMQHQFVERETGRICTEQLVGDKPIQLLYSLARERVPILFRAPTGPRASSLLAAVNYDGFLDRRTMFSLRKSGVDFSECIAPKELNTARKIFERQIRYWEHRPMPESARAVASPADSRVIVGSLSEISSLFLKEKFFDLEELLGKDKPQWIDEFTHGDFAIFRLTPEKYHYNHTPVAGQVVDVYEIPGGYHSCNPGAVVTVVTPFSKNKRVVTIMDTDVPGGTGAGLVAMIEIVALMIGDIVQAYSETRYENPRTAAVGMFLGKGLPKSLFRPGSSTDVLLFQNRRVEFSEDLVRNLCMSGVQSRFSKGFGRSLVETDLKVRSVIGTACAR